jgi:Fe-S cluster assembly iron-binding protein IscA
MLSIIKKEKIRFLLFRGGCKQNKLSMTYKTQIINKDKTINLKYQRKVIQEEEISITPTSIAT